MCIKVALLPALKVTCNAPTQFSFAISPDNIPTVACQSPIPNGLKIGAIILPK